MIQAPRPATATGCCSRWSSGSRFSPTQSPCPSRRPPAGRPSPGKVLLPQSFVLGSVRRNVRGQAYIHICGGLHIYMCSLACSTSRARIPTPAFQMVALHLRPSCSRSRHAPNRRPSRLYEDVDDRQAGSGLWHLNNVIPEILQYLPTSSPITPNLVKIIYDFIL